MVCPSAKLSPTHLPSRLRQSTQWLPQNSPRFQEHVFDTVYLPRYPPFIDGLVTTPSKGMSRNAHTRSSMWLSNFTVDSPPYWLGDLLDRETLSLGALDGAGVSICSIAFVSAPNNWPIERRPG